MNKLLIAAFAALLTFASEPVFAREVQLNDAEKSELRARAERLQQGVSNRATDVRRGASDMSKRTGAKAKKLKNKAKYKAKRAKQKIKNA